MASKCVKCGNEKDYNFALNIGLCNPCIGERFENIEELYSAATKALNTQLEITAKLQNRIKKIEEERVIETEIICGLIDCLNRNKSGICGASIHLQSCSDAANVVACSEFSEQALKGK